MKQLFILAACIGLLAISACKKNEKKDPFWAYQYGSIKITRNGKEWNARIRAGMDSLQSKTFFIGVVDARSTYFWDVMGIANIDPKSGSYNFITDCYNLDSLGNEPAKTICGSYNGSFSEGSDVSSSSHIRQDRPRYITIDSYDPNTRMVSGSFAISFKRNKEKPLSQGYLDTVNYANAHFSVKILTRAEFMQEHERQATLEE